MFCKLGSLRRCPYSFSERIFRVPRRCDSAREVRTEFLSFPLGSRGASRSALENECKTRSDETRKIIAGIRRVTAAGFAVTFSLRYCVRYARSRARARAHARTHVRTGEGDRPTKIKSTSAPGAGAPGGWRAGRDGREGGPRARICCCWRRQRRSAGEPAGESHLSAHASSYPFLPFCLPLARSPLALAPTVPQSSLSPSPTGPPQPSPRPPPPSIFISFLLLCRTPRPRDTLSLSPPLLSLFFSLHFLCPPLVQMARTISRVVSCRAPMVSHARATNVLFDCHGLQRIFSFTRSLSRSPG